MQVEVAVVTKAVTVWHAPALVCPATLVAALNEAHLEASLTFPRQQLQVRGVVLLLQLLWLLCSLVAPGSLGWQGASAQRWAPVRGQLSLGPQSGGN